MAIGGLIGGAISPDVIKAPSIGDAQKQTAQAGVPRPVVYGHPAPFSGNIIDGEAKARKITVKTRQGKGGGPIVKSERFIMTTAIRICEGPIAGVIRIWRNGEVVYDRRTDAAMPVYSGSTAGSRAIYAAQMRAKSGAFANKIRIYLGDEAQLPDPSLEAIHGVGNTPYFRGTAYIVVTDDDVTDTRGAASQWQFEVAAAGTETSAVVVVPDAGILPVASQSGGMVNALATYTVSKSVIGPMILASANWGHAIGGYDAPARVLVRDGSMLIFDSGWMGDAAFQSSLDAVLASEGRLDLSGSINSATAGVSQTVITRGGSLSVDITIYRAGPTGSASQGSVAFRYPDAALLPASVTLTPEAPGAMLGSDGKLYYPSWVTPPDLSTLTPTAGTLRAVVEDIAARCNVPASKIDAAALTDIIPGFLVAQQFTGADTLKPTQQAFFYDLPEVDGKILAVKRGGATVVAITEDDLLEAGQDDERVRSQAVDYPLKVSVVTQDPAAEYSPIPQTSGRTDPDFSGSSEVVVQLPIPFGADQSAQIAHKLHKVLHSQAEGRIELALPDNFSRYVASDAIDYQSKRWLIEEVRYSDGEVRWKAVYDRASNYGSTVTGQAPTPPTLPASGLRGPTLLEVVNAPPLRVLDDRIGIYVAVGGTFAGWDGCTVLGSIDGGATVTALAEITGSSVMGYITTALPIADGSVIDASNTVRVSVNGELHSITGLQLLAEGNPCVIGAELCQFQTATPVSDGVYDLSILTRGRLDSTAAAHVAGERFVLLDAPVFVELPSSWIGKTIALQAVTNGTLPANNATQSFTWQPALIQTEWAPVQFVGTRSAGNDISIAWNGRGRLGTTATPYQSAYFDGYRVKIAQGGATVTKATTTAQALAYSAAEQTADFGSTTGTLTVTVEAMNRITGPSAALTGTIA